MTMKKQQQTSTTKMEKGNHNEEDTDTGFTSKSDVCEQLLVRYGKSSAPQHRHLCATAAATRSIIQSESLPLTPLSYFAAAIDAVFETSKTLDANAVAALSAFLAIVLPLVPDKAIAPSKAAYAVSVLVELLERPGEAVSVSSVRAVVKCLGVLVGFSDLEDWDSVKLGFQTLLKFSIDKRPKVRKCAQDCVVKVFKLFESSTIIKSASKLVFSLLKSYMPLAVKLSVSRLIDGSKDDILSKPEHLEVLHMLNLLKHFVPYLSVKVNLKVLSELQILMKTQFSALTRHIFDIIVTIFESMGSDSIILEAENIIESLASYVSLRANPVDTVLSAANLLKSALNILYVGEPVKGISHLPLVIGSVAGLLTSEAGTASQASNILKVLINGHIDRSNENLLVDDAAGDSVESSALKSTCAVFVKLLSPCDGIPNEHILAVISVLFLKLGEISYFYTKDIILKLSEFMTVPLTKTSEAKYLEECIGSAVIAMGPEKLLMLLPISLDTESLTCSNIWLLPILKNYVFGSSLGFYMEHVVPLAESFQRACRKAKVKKTVIGQDLQAHAHGCWGLLPSFCRHPTDTHKNFGALSKLILPLLKKDSFMLENIAISLQELVNQNRNVLGTDLGAGEFETLPKPGAENSEIYGESKPSYSRKTASRNIRSLASCSKELLQALTDVLLESPREKRTYLKDAIGCLASITDSSMIKIIFMSSLERLQLTRDLGECEKMEKHPNASVDKKSNFISAGKDAKRYLILELASSIVEGASQDLIDEIFNFIRQTLQETDEIGQYEAYLTLNKLLEKHSWFCSSKFDELMDLLLGLKSPVDITILKSRFTCFQTLLVHTIESLDQENTKAFLILNEIILALKDSRDEGRKVAYDILLGIGSTLRNSSSATSDGPYHKLISMITGYLSGSSPQIKSGAVSALSVLVHNDANICLLMPDLVPSVLELLYSKAIEVIKAVLGFVKVLVLSLQAKDLQNFLSEIVNRILPWSSVSRHHFRSKVTVILEIMMRRCGSASVKLLAPEKYQGFLKDVLENHRHGKTSSKEAGTTEIEPKPVDSSERGSDLHTKQQKRKRGEAGTLSKEDDSVEPRKRKREEKWKGVTPRTKQPGFSDGTGDRVKWGKDKHSDRDKLTKGQSPASRMNKGKNWGVEGTKRRNFNSDSPGGKRKMGQAKGNKKVGKK